MAMAIKQTNNTKTAGNRCLTCDGLIGRDAYVTVDRRVLAETRACPECGGLTRQCSHCGEWLAFSWFNTQGSKYCTLCLDIKRAQRPWTPAEAKRLYEAGRKFLDLWPKYYDRWQEDDLIIWRAFLSAMERSKPGAPDGDVMLSTE